MDSVTEVHLIVIAVWVLKFIDDAINAKVEAHKNKPPFSTEQMSLFAEAILTTHLIGFKRLVDRHVTRYEFEKVARLITRAQQEYLR